MYTGGRGWGGRAISAHKKSNGAPLLCIQKQAVSCILTDALGLCLYLLVLTKSVGCTSTNKIDILIKEEHRPTIDYHKALITGSSCSPFDSWFRIVILHIENVAYKIWINLNFES